MFRSTLVAFVGFAVLTSLALGPAEAQEPQHDIHIYIDWSYSDGATCGEDGGPELTLQCGDYGTFHFGVGSRSLTCVEEQGSYPRRFYGSPSPNNPPIQTPPRGEILRDGIETGWLAVIDYFYRSSHGDWVVSVIDTISPGAEITRYALDDPALSQVLGEDVTDAHLLAALCSVREEIDNNGLSKPLVTNLSFGRHWIESDPEAPDPDCTAGLRCHVVNLIHWLNADSEDGKGRSVVITAAGNHLHETFPASLTSTIAVGAADITRLRVLGEVAPLQETGRIFDALFPAQNLCSNGYATPFGTSFAAALLTGALAENDFQVAVPVEGRIGMNNDGGGFKLSFEGTPMGESLPGIDELFSWVADGERAPACGGNEIVVTETLRVEPATGDPMHPNLQVYNATAFAPMPEENYCVPCFAAPLRPTTGFAGDLELNDLRIDVSGAVASLAGSIIDSIYYRYVDSQGSIVYNRVLSSEGFRGRLSRGQIDQIVLEQVWIPTDEQPSLEFVLRPNASADCSVDIDDCPRTSIPIQL